jgi:hypothetical protein
MASTDIEEKDRLYGERKGLILANRFVSVATVHCIQKVGAVDEI